MSCVFITGATSGIGLQLTKDYAQAGWQVIACGRNKDKLKELQDTHHTVTGLAFDVTDLDAAKAALKDLTPEPQLWILNAGDCEYIDDGVIDAALVKRVFDINVIGLVNTIEACQPRFSLGHRVAIVGSIASEMALPRAEAYGASKAAVSYLARTLQVDLRPKGVEVSVIYPGFVATPLTDKNTFPMPMMVSVEEASQAIRLGLSKGRPHIYFPAKFTSILRLIGLLPYRWQNTIAAKLMTS
ncbi:SDR family NAD(P)-dependent oxidoreductase [Vibrio sinaloensis]|uniref:SDR family NAD(P)-dependent oxidoreductase n=1 Tax=Photobacterium sp. (strain ATCC 43367) TaxID=379097 RepID=UPI0035EFADA7